MSIIDHDPYDELVVSTRVLGLELAVEVGEWPPRARSRPTAGSLRRRATVSARSGGRRPSCRIKIRRCLSCSSPQDVDGRTCRRPRCSATGRRVLWNSEQDEAAVERRDVGTVFGRQAAREFAVVHRSRRVMIGRPSLNAGALLFRNACRRTRCLSGTWLLLVTRSHLVDAWSRPSANTRGPLIRAVERHARAFASRRWWSMPRAVYGSVWNNANLTVAAFPLGALMATSRPCR